MAGSIEAYIRQAAAARGINPDVAVAVARSEGGLTNPTQQSYVIKNGRRETSYGPFQLKIGGGLGDGALKAGIDPRKETDWQKGVDVALNYAARHGWGSWYGAAKAGVSNFAGINKASRALALNSDTGVSAAQQAAAAMASGQAGGVLRQGSRGPAVSQLQQQLASAGLYKGKVDGSYGPQTAAAVRAAESTYGLTRDKGVAGPQVQAALAGTGATQDITSTFGLAPPGGPADMPGFDPVANGLGHAPGGYAPPYTPPDINPDWQPNTMGDLGQGAKMPPMTAGPMARNPGDLYSSNGNHLPMDALDAPPMGPRALTAGGPQIAAPSPQGLPPGLSSADLSFTPHSLNSGVARGAPYPAPPVGPQIAAAPQSAPGGPPLALPASLPYRGSPPYSGFGPTLGAPSAEEAAAMARNRDREVTAVRHVPDFAAEFATPFHQPARPITPTPDWMQRQDDANAQFGNELVNGIGNFFGGSAPATAKPSLYDIAPSAVPDSNRFTPTDITPYLPVTGQQSSIGGFPQAASLATYESDPSAIPFADYVSGRPVLSGEEVFGNPAAAASPMGRIPGFISRPGDGMLNHAGGLVDLPSRFSDPGYRPWPSGMIPGLQQLASADPGFVPGGPTDAHFADTFGPAGGQPAISGVSFGGDYAGMLQGQPGTQFDMAPLGYTPPRPASLDVSSAGSLQERAKALSDAMHAAVVTGAGAGQSGGNSGSGIVPSQSYGGSPGAYSFSGFSPWGSATYNAPYGQTGYSNSPFTPSGYNAPDFNSSSGGATYSWQADPNNPGHGTYYNSSGQKLSF